MHVFKADGKIFCSNLRYNTNLYCIKEQAECRSGKVHVWHVKGSRFDPQLGHILYCIFLIGYLLLILSRTIIAIIISLIIFET